MIDHGRSQNNPNHSSLKRQNIWGVQAHADDYVRPQLRPEDERCKKLSPQQQQYLDDGTKLKWQVLQIIMPADQTMGVDQPAPSSLMVKLRLQKSPQRKQSKPERTILLSLTQTIKYFVS